MKAIHKPIRVFTRITSLMAMIALALCVMSPTQAAIFAKYEGIDGESMDAEHLTWIDILSLDWPISAASGGATGPTRRRGEVDVGDVTMVQELDKSYPKLFSRITTGEITPTVEIHFTAFIGDSNKTYFEMLLRNVLLTELNLSGETGASVPTVVAGNNFEEITVTYTEYLGDGSSAGRTEASWRADSGEASAAVGIVGLFARGLSGPSISAIPLPAAVWCFAPAILALGGMCRRRTD
jgi:type VI secretion system Hcp family effector